MRIISQGFVSRRASFLSTSYQYPFLSFSRQHDRFCFDLFALFVSFVSSNKYISTCLKAALSWADSIDRDAFPANHSRWANSPSLSPLQEVWNHLEVEEINTLHSVTNPIQTRLNNADSILTVSTPSVFHPACRFSFSFRSILDFQGIQS